MALKKSPFSLKKHSMPLMALFAEAVEWAVSQPRIRVEPAGHIAVEPRERGGKYAYWVRYNAAKKQQREYLGPEGSEKHLAAAAALEGFKKIGEHARNLRQLGFEAVEHEAALVIAVLCNAGTFSGGGVLIGTRAFGSLINHLGYKATPFLATQDIDIGRYHGIKLATALPDGGFVELLRQSGLRFVEVPGLERPPGPPTSFRVVGRDLKVDLLVPARPSSKPYSTVPVTELRAHATTLPFLDYLVADSWRTIIVGRDHLIPVRCPQPARYCLHKLIVADIRSGLENPKIEKDVAQAGILAVILGEDDPEALENAASAMSAAMQKHARKSFVRLERQLANDYPEALERLRRLLFVSSTPVPKNRPILPE